MVRAVLTLTNDNVLATAGWPELACDPTGCGGPRSDQANVRRIRAHQRGRIGPRVLRCSLAADPVGSDPDPVIDVTVIGGGCSTARQADRRGVEVGHAGGSGKQTPRLPDIHNPTRGRIAHGRP